MKLTIVVALAALAPSLTLIAGDELKNAYIFGVTEKTNALAYAVGEEMVFTLSVKGAKALPKTPLWLQWSREGDDGVRASGKEPLSLEKPLVIRTRLGKPGFVHIGADVVDAQGNRWERYDPARGVEGARGLHYDGGAGTNPRELHESPGEPKDFDAFWAGRKARLAALPLVVDRKEVAMVKPVEGVRAYAVTVNCAGPRPVTGYLYLPERPGRYRAEVRFDGYSGDSVQKPEDGGLSTDLIVFHINAHGYELGREPEYYREFYESIMIGGTYAFDARQNKTAGSAYFGGMTWRVLRALQYVKSLPEWDGANLHVRGGSQGGLQAIWAAGLDSDVSSVTTHVTWCCDMAGPKTQGRMQGWWPEWTEALGYFDAVYHAKRIASKAEVSIVKAALGDTCSRPSSLAVLYNNIPCKKQIVWVQGASHGYVMPGAPTWKTEDIPMDFDGELFNPKTEAFKHPDVTWKPQWSVVTNATSVTMAYPEKGTNRVSQWAHAGFDFAGAAFTGFEFEIDVECLGCDADDPATKVTFLAMPRDAAGKAIYAGASYDFRKGGRQTLRVSWTKPGVEIRPGTLGLNAGLAGPGKVVFHTDTLRYRPLAFPFPRVNASLSCRYTDLVAKRPVCRGTMVRARTVTPKDIDDLADAGATLIRFPLCADCLPQAPAPTNRGEEIAYFRNWLKAGLDHFEADILPVCRRRGIRVVLGVFDAPGRKPDGHDFALFRDEGYLREWIRQWEAIARRFKGNEDVLYGYDLINEPHQVGLAEFDYWTIQKLCAKAIRRIDRVTPIIFESNQADDVEAYAYMSPVDIENVIYEAHMYHPFPFTHQGVGTLSKGFRYPDDTKGWNRAFLERKLQPLFDFAKRHGARVYVGEFSAATWGEGGDEWVRDVISILNRHSVDWSYHCFREWKGWDPELSSARWNALTSGWKEKPVCEGAPSFVWRGMMLDCSRHFFTVEEVKRNLDIMAELKLNLFHWHLTDGRGWRIEIDRYPELTKSGAMAPSNLKRRSRWGRDVSDSGNGKYGPYFYTKAEIREIVAYAKARGIDVLPEVEIPGHSDAAIRAYPFLKCASGGRNELCLGRDEVLRFYENVLDEVCELFPFGFLHIGGDECNVSSWAKCADCQARKKTIGGKREQDLQHWVTRHFAEYLAKKGKRIVGWDEIAGDPLLRKDAVVMNWRGGTYAVDAARTGHDVVVCCHSPCYLDYPQQLENDPYEYIAFGGWLTAEAAYQYDPYRNFPPELRHRVLGGQGNVWTEITADQKELEWKTYTRLAVLAEVLNRHTELPRDWQAFRPTLEKRIAALKAKGVNMAPTGPLRKAEIAFPGGRKVKWGGGVCPILASKLTRNANGIEVKIDTALKAGEWKLSVDWRTARISVPDDASADRALAEIESVSFKYEPGVICIPIVKAEMAPPCDEGLVSFLAVTGKPTEAAVHAKVEEIQKQGIGSFLVYARSGLEVEYMGEEWLRICDWFCSEAHRRGMKVWLYDEYNWPSGTCKGRVPQENDAWRYRELGVFPDGRGGFRWTEAFAPAGWVNVCEPAAVERFMELTHRVYEKRLAEWFGNGTIVGIFTDEPGHPTTVAFPEGRPLVSFRDYSGLEAEYKEETGRELRSDVERWLRQPQDDEVWPVYVSLLGRRFRSTYFDRIRDWCDRMGIVSTGHLISENDLASSARQNGLPLLCLRGESLPGVDEIRTAYDPTNVRVPIEWTMYNLVRQAILHRGNRGGLIELFACGPADLTPGVLRQVIWMSAFHGIDRYVSCMDVMDERGLVEKHGYLSPAGSVHPWYVAHAGVLADEARKAAQFARKTVSEGEVAVRYPQRQAALSAFAGGRVPRHLTDLLGSLELNQFTCRLVGEDESSDLPLVFGCSPDGRYFEERSGRKGLTTEEAVLMCGKLPRSFSVRGTDGAMAGDLMVRTYSDGSSAVINLKPSSVRTLWAERNGAKSRFFLQPHGVRVFATGGLPPSEAEHSTVRSLADVEWELSVDRDNLLRVNFTSARQASVRFDGDVKNVKVVARDLAVSYAVTGSGRPIGLNEAAPKGEKVLRHEAEPYSFAIDGRPMGESGRCSELPSVFNPLYRTLEPRDFATGTHEFSIVTGEPDRNYFLPALFLSGDFLVKDGGVSPRRTNKVRFGTLADYGYSNYVGKATWSAEVVAPDDPGVCLRLRTGGQVTSVRFCGVDLGVKAWEPCEWELPASLRGRKGSLEISLWTSAQPMFGDEHAPGAEWDARFWQAVHMPGSNCGLQDGDWVVGKVISVGTGPREAL